MPQIDINKPVRLGRAFWSVYALLLGPSIWILRPSSSHLPPSSVIIGALLIPFLVAIALYSSGLFLIALVTDFRRQQQYFALFFLILLGQLAAMAVVIYYLRLGKGISGMPVLVAFAVCALLNFLIFILIRKKPGWPGPASDLVNPERDGESRPE